MLCDRIIIIDEGRKIYDGSIDEIKSRYGSKGVLCVEPNDMHGFEALDIIGHFRNKDDALTCELNEGRATLTFNKNKLTSAELLSFILHHTTASDISIGEVSIEDIVKQIYNEGV